MPDVRHLESPKTNCFILCFIFLSPDPCPDDDYFHCKAENICMDGRLKCDGIKQCDDGEDESDCSSKSISLHYPRLLMMFNTFKVYIVTTCS